MPWTAGRLKKNERTVALQVKMTCKIGFFDDSKLERATMGETLCQAAWGMASRKALFVQVKSGASRIDFP